MSIERVPVAKIVEYNWNLGSRCYLLNQAGLHPYFHTEEEVTSCLEQSAEDPTALSICLQSSRCSTFYESFRAGKTPFIEKDPIKLLEYGGKYWVSEGKHRVCMAKRSGVQHIDAQVYHLEEDTETLLEQVGEPGTYAFSSYCGMRHQKGTVAILWVEPPRGNYSIYSCGPQILNMFPGKEQPKTEVVPGVYVEVTSEKRCKWFFKRNHLCATITIEQNHCNTGIWLYTIPANRSAIFPVPNTVYRYGCWRKRHINQMIPSSRYFNV